MADSVAFSLYQKAMAEGVVSDPNVLTVFSHMRALAALNNLLAENRNYNANALINAETAGKISYEDAKNEPLVVVLEPIYKRIGEQIADRTAASFVALLKTQNQLEAQGQGFMSPDQIKELRRLNNLYENAPTEEMQALLDSVDIPDYAADLFKEEYDFQIMAQGERAAFEDVRFVYDAAKQELMAGNLDDNHLLKVFAENIVLGMERLAPDHYGVSEPLYADHIATKGMQVARPLEAAPSPGLGSPSA